jgi:hypothetical protein
VGLVSEVAVGSDEVPIAEERAFLLVENSERMR